MKISNMKTKITIIKDKEYEIYDIEFIARLCKARSISKSTQINSDGNIKYGIKIEFNYRLEYEEFMRVYNWYNDSKMK